MASYRGVMYFANGTTRELSVWNGYGPEQAEREAAREFNIALQQWERSGMSDFFKPTRYDVKEVKW